MEEFLFAAHTSPRTPHCKRLAGSLCRSLLGMFRRMAKAPHIYGKPIKRSYREKPERECCLPALMQAVVTMLVIMSIVYLVGSSMRGVILQITRNRVAFSGF